jgi:SAM-dependent methyltransferase
MMGGARNAPKVNMSEHVDKNRELWTQTHQQFTGADAAGSWAQERITWGCWSIDEASLEVLGDVEGLDVIELGCGTAYFSSWLARRGARVTGVDVTPAQLASARACQAQFGLSFPLIEANAERVPLPDAGFDLALSEYGACLWCDPALWVREAARLLRSGGRLIFLTNSPLVTMCLPDDVDAYAGTQLLHGPAATRRLATSDGGVEFHPSHGEWIALLRANGFAIERLLELHVPANAVDHEFYKVARVDWGRRWPVEDLWVARKL